MSMNIFSRFYRKFGVRKTNKAVTVIALGCLIVDACCATYLTYHAGYTNGKEDITDYVLSHPELFQ